MTRSRFDLTRQTRQILLRLYDAVAAGRESFTFADWEEVLGGKSRNLWELCIAELKDNGLISTDRIQDNYNAIDITRLGTAEVDDWPDDVFEITAQGFEFPDVNHLAGPESVPASDRNVTLDHNQSDYQQAIEALDKVLEEFRKVHRLDNVFGPQKEAHLKVLEGGRKALEDKEISVENGQGWIVKPLKWIGEKFADGALKVLAAKALELFAKLLGLGN